MESHPCRDWKALWRWHLGPLFNDAHGGAAGWWLGLMILNHNNSVITFIIIIIIIILLHVVWKINWEKRMGIQGMQRAGDSSRSNLDPKPLRVKATSRGWRSNRSSGDAPQGSLNLLRASWAFPAPLRSALGGSWEQQDFGGFVTRENLSLTTQQSPRRWTLIWDFFLFSLGRKMIKTRPGNLWSRRGLYLLGNGAVLVMPHHLFACTTFDLPALSKEITGNSRLYLPFKSDTGQIIFSCARQDFFSEGISNISCYFANNSTPKALQWLKTCTLMVFICITNKSTF